MAITSADIDNQSFSISKRGYDVDEVDVFLERVASEIDAMNQLIARLQGGDSDSSVDGGTTASEPIDVTALQAGEGGDIVAQLKEKDEIIADLEAKLKDKSQNDNAISQALIVAQKSADEIVANANTKADITIQDAHDEADRIVSRAETEKENIMAAIAKLEEDKEGTRNGYAELLRDFIEDANAKLGNLGFVDDTPKQIESGIDYDQADVMEFDVDRLTETKVIPAHSAVASNVVEKDLSGFGVVDDDIDDLD